jgi:hypothetical protein
LKCDEDNNFLCYKENRTFCRQVSNKNSY